MKNMRLSFKLVLLVVLMFVGVIASSKKEAFAAAVDPVQVCAVSYADESILVITNGNTKIYFANEMEASRGNWDVIEANASDTLAVIDISWLAQSTENILLIKGNNNPTTSRIILLPKPTKLEVSINYSMLDNAGSTVGQLLNIMTTEGSAADPITYNDLQWKKGESGEWMSAALLKKELLESYLIKGTDLYFRIAPKDDVVSASNVIGAFDLGSYARTYAYYKPRFNDNTDAASRTIDTSLTYGTDYPDGTEGRRASEGVKLKIAKKAILPVTGVDGEEFMINMKYGQEYRVTATGITPVWTKITDRYMKKMSLATMLGGTYDGITKSFPEMKIEIRNYSTYKASSSKITETNLEAQRVLSGEIKTTPAAPTVTASDLNIYITYNGTKNINIQIPSASDENPYEYSVVRDGYTFDVNKASWSSITKGTIVKILSSKAIDKSTLYIRQKEIKYKAGSTASSTAVAYKLPSTVKTFDVNYPTIPVAPKQTYTFTKKYTKELTIDVTLNVSGKLPFETELKYIKLGTKDVPLEKDPVITATGTAPNQVYTMTISLNVAALELMPNCTARALSIYYKNGTVDKTSSKLTIKNATEALGMTTTTSPGTLDGTTSVKIENSIGVANHLVYEVGAQVSGVKMEDKFDGVKTFTSGMDIAITAGQYLTIYELNAENYVMKYKSIQINDGDIKKPAATGP